VRKLRAAALLHYSITPIFSMARWHSCNILYAAADARRVWQFDAGKFSLNREQTSYPGEPLPARMIGKDWRSLFQQKLNVAWLPPESVFLRVIQLPKASLDETISMVELQLEKLSPVPVTQIVWTLHVLPHAAEGMQTALVVIVARNVVEEFLGKLEGQGYTADRLEVSFLEQLLATTIVGDGAWVYPEVQGAKNTAVVAWWYGGVLRNFDFILLPPGALMAANLRDQLRQMLWAGELEGWITAPPAWHLVAGDSVAMEWEPVLRQAVETSIDAIAPLNPQAAAALSARRAVGSETKINLMPAEFSTRYRQQFVDRLWMRGLLAVGVVYVAGVLVYFAALEVLTLKASGVERQVAGVSNTYTNAIQLKARYGVLKDRQELKYAALDCWKAVADLLPASVTLESLNFNDGQKLLLGGMADSSAVNELIDFCDALRKTQVNGQPLFDQKKGDQVPSPRAAGGNVSWTFNLELKRTETP